MYSSLKYLHDEIKDDGMGGVCSTCGGDEKSMQGFGGEK
jgi:hypothetical protein